MTLMMTLICGNCPNRFEDLMDWSDEGLPIFWKEAQEKGWMFLGNVADHDIHVCSQKCLDEINERSQKPEIHMGVWKSVEWIVSPPE